MSGMPKVLQKKISPGNNFFCVRLQTDYCPTQNSPVSRENTNGYATRILAKKLEIPGRKVECRMQKIARVSKEVAKSVLAGTCQVGSVSAANLYKEGRTPYRMLKVVEPVPGTVTPVFIIGDQPLRF